MVIAEIRTNQQGAWIGQLCDAETGKAVGSPWIAESRSELIGKMITTLPFPGLQMRDVIDPLDP